MSALIKKISVITVGLLVILILLVVLLQTENKDNQEKVSSDVQQAHVQANSNLDQLEYSYIEKSIVAADEENNIVVGLKDESAVIESAQLNLAVGSNKEKTVQVDMDKVINNTARFTTNFDEKACYKLSSLTYSISNNPDPQYVDFANEDDQSLVFDVVDSKTADTLNASISSNNTTSTFVMNEDGSMKGAESVDDALSIAGKKNVSQNNVQNEDAVGKVITDTREDFLIVAIDPGHGGSDSGACGYGLTEKEVNLSIATHMYNSLNWYTGVYPYLVRSTDEYVGLQERVDRAANMKADVFVCIHNNSGGGSGCEVWAPNSSSYNYETHTVGTELAKKIAAQISALGLKNRGVKTRDSETGSTYPDGSRADYYTVINAARRVNMPGIIVEHAFMDNASDASKLADNSFRRSLGVADTNGVVEQYKLGLAGVAQQSSLVALQAHVQGLGWEQKVFDGKVSGTTGKGRRMEALKISLQNDAASSGGIQYRSYANGTWQSWAANGETCGYEGQCKAIEAVQLNLTGDAAHKYDIYYRVHCGGYGWLGWAKNGEEAGTIGYAYDGQAIEVVLVDKGGEAPGSTANHVLKRDEVSILYSVHAQGHGWMNEVGNNEQTGTVGEGLRLEALKINLVTGKYSGGIKYAAHVQGIGWQDPVGSGQIAGTTGKERRVEAFTIELDGQMAEKYDIYYRLHCQGFGWLDWAKNGAPAGTAGYGYRAEAIQIDLVDKDAPAPGSTERPFVGSGIYYQAHIQGHGWMNRVFDGATAGTTGEGMRMEAMRINLTESTSTSTIQYRSHIQGKGWETTWHKNGEQTGTTGSSMRLEAIQINISGSALEKYDIYYRVHAQGFGWMGWAKNGEYAGTEGFGYRLEAIQIKLVTKGGAAPGSTDNPYRKYGDTSSPDIMGTAMTNAAQMARCFNATGHAYPSSVYSSKGAASIESFCQILYEEACDEGVRPEILFSQAMHETGWLQFGGDVKPEQCNFGGLGATGGGSKGATFPNVATGLRAQTQHLKAYASTAPLNKECVDPRFNYVTRGCAPTVHGLDGKWAVPGVGYGAKIMEIVKKTLAA